MSASEHKIPDWPTYARRVVEQVIHGREPANLPAPSAESWLHGGVFVTLRKFGELRGCMGVLDENLPLPEAVKEAAVSAALHDPRFPPMHPAELNDLTVEVSILSRPCRMESLDELEIGRHGVLVRRGGCRGLYLPQVATEFGFDKETFLSRCCSEKAGLPPDAWKDPRTEVLLFTAEVYREGEGGPAG